MTVTIRTIGPDGQDVTVDLDANLLHMTLLASVYRKALEQLHQALGTINDWCNYASEEDTSASAEALQQIGILARASLDAAAKALEA